MQAWPAPDAPRRCPGRGLPLRLFDTAAGRRWSTDRPGADGPDVRLRHHAVRRDAPGPRRDLRRPSTCVQRVWRDAGHDVHYVQNVTDVDDPLLERAARDGEDWRELAERETELFREDMAALRGAAARRTYVGAVEAIPAIVDVDRAAARARRGLRRRRRHSTSRSHADPRFGAVERPRRATQMLALFAERGGDPDRPGKKRPARLPALAGRPPGRAVLGRRPARPPAGPAGTSSARRSRSTTSGTAFDVQGGGSDLVFPHHEMSASRGPGRSPASGRSRGTTCTPGMVGLDGEKMSQVPGQPGVRLRAAPRRASTRWRSGWRCSRTTTAATGSGPTTTSTAAEQRLARWRDGGRPADRAAGRGRCSPRCARPWPTTSTRPPRSPPSTAGPQAAVGRATRSRRRRHRDLVRRDGRRAARRRLLSAAAQPSAARRLVAAPAQVALELPGDRLAGRLGQRRRCPWPPRASGRTRRPRRPRRPARRRRAPRRGPPRAGRRAGSARRAGPRSGAAARASPSGTAAARRSAGPRPRSDSGGMPARRAGVLQDPDDAGRALVARRLEVERARPAPGRTTCRSPGSGRVCGVSASSAPRVTTSSTPSSWRQPSSSPAERPPAHVRLDAADEHDVAAEPGQPGVRARRVVGQVISPADRPRRARPCGRLTWKS